MATEDFEKTIASETATKCIAKAQDASSGSGEASECKNTSHKAMMCVAKEFFLACPTELQNTSEKCVKIREMVQNGKPGGPAPEEPQPAPEDE